MNNTVRLSDAQVMVVLQTLKNAHVEVNPEYKPDIEAIHDHIWIQCSKMVQKGVKPLGKQYGVKIGGA